MSSKIEKQKQISALLNSRFSQDFVSSELSDLKQSLTEESKFKDQVRLMFQVYQFYKSIIQNVNVGLITVDLNGEITFANRSAASLLNCQVKDILGMNIAKFFVNSGDAAQILKIIEVSGKRLSEREFKFRDSQNKELIVGVTASRIQDENNKFDGIVILMRDLTEVRHLRNQVERMERLALLGELSAGIAHEIRNPLAGIKASVQVLEETFGADDFRNELVARIVREVDKANRLLRDFFKFAKPMKPRLGFHNIEMIVDSVYLLLAPKLKKRNIQFQEEFEEDIPQIYADETQIEQVILNLFLNAIDAMEEGGTLGVKVSKKKLMFVEPSKREMAVTEGELYYIIVEISDTGAGISRENLQKIFNPFFTTKPEGLGLGLSICSRLIEENRGKIDVVSAPGKGTTFILALPAFIYR